MGVGRILKKNGVALDIINFGGESVEQNQEAIVHVLTGAAGLDLQAAQKHIQEALTAPDCTCHLLTVRTGEDLNGALVTSPILLGDDGSATVANFGMDEDMDPELAMVLESSAPASRLILWVHSVISRPSSSPWRRSSSVCSGKRAAGPPPLHQPQQQQRPTRWPSMRPTRTRMPCWLGRSPCRWRRPSRRHHRSRLRTPSGRTTNKG